MGFSRQEYWSGLLCPPPGDFPNPGIKPKPVFLVSCIGRQALYHQCHLGSPSLYIYIHVLFSIEKEWNFDTCCSIDEAWAHYTKWNKPVTKGQMLYDSTYMRYLEYSGSYIETEATVMVTKSWGEGDMGSLFNGCGVSVWEDEESSGNGWWWWLNNNVKILNELYT